MALAKTSNTIFLQSHAEYHVIAFFFAGKPEVNDAAWPRLLLYYTICTQGCVECTIDPTVSSLEVNLGVASW